MYEWTEEQARAHPLFSKFWEYAEQTRRDSEHFEDWKDWWDCFYSGMEVYKWFLTTQLDKSDSE